MATPAARAYFDHAATAPMLPTARQAWLEASDLIGNPTGLHASARRMRAVLEDARESLAADLGAHPSEVVFTASASEADSIAVLGGRTVRAPRPWVVVSAVEHPGVATVVNHVEAVRLIEVDRRARVALESAHAVIDEEVALVSVQLVNGEVGTIQPVEQVVEIGHAAGALVHTDAVQGLISPGLNFAGLGVDLASVAAHKVGGPVGIGALLVARGVELGAAGLGSGQERGIVSGTPSAALAAAFAAGLRESLEHRAATLVRCREIRERIVRCLAMMERVRVNGPGSADEQVPGILHATIAQVRADDVLFLLDQAGVDASTGASCRAGMHQPSDVVLAMTGSLEKATSSIRLSFGAETSDAEVEQLLRVLPETVARARRAGGAWR